MIASGGSASLFEIVSPVCMHTMREGRHASIAASHEHLACPMASRSWLASMSKGPAVYVRARRKDESKGRGRQQVCPGAFGGQGFGSNK